MLTPSPRNVVLIWCSSLRISFMPIRCLGDSAEHASPISRTAMMHCCNFSLPWNKLPVLMVYCSTPISLTASLFSSTIAASVSSVSPIARSV
ncbi:hypothetical protein LguiA_007759 [Lonicera macranthoides]